MPSQQLDCECTKTITEQKSFAALMQVHQDKRRIKHSTKKIKERLETLRFRLENDGMYGSKWCFSPPLSIM